jgi:hypothetical protein
MIAIPRYNNPGFPNHAFVHHGRDHVQAQCRGVLAGAADDVDPLLLEADFLHRLLVLALEPLAQGELLADSAEDDSAGRGHGLRDRNDVDRLSGGESERVLRVLQAVQLVEHPHDGGGGEEVLVNPTQ